MAAATEQHHEAIVNEEYKIWKKNAPFLYDIVMSHALDWPSLTVDWLPTKHPVADQDYSEHHMVLGTHTAENEQNTLMVVKVRLPNEDAEIDARKYDDQQGELGGYGGLVGKVETVAKMNHNGEVNRARHCPQSEFLIATKSPTGKVYIYDYSKHPSTVEPEDTTCKPQLTLAGHTEEGYGLCWSNLKAGHLISGSDDKTVCLWDTNAAPGASGEVDPLMKFTEHGDVVEDVDWHRHHEHMFGSVGDDKHVYIWDTRSPAKALQAVQGHKGEVNSISFSPFNEFTLLTGSSDKTVALWDSRKMSQRLHSFESHTDEVFTVQWAPFNEAIFASSGSDRRVHIWDTSRIGQEQTPEDAEDGPPELLFIHGGHTAKVSDFSWEMNQDWVMASVSEDNILQVWQLAENIYNDQDDEEADEPADDDLE